MHWNAKIICQTIFLIELANVYVHVQIMAEKSSQPYISEYRRYGINANDSDSIEDNQDDSSQEDHCELHKESVNFTTFPNDVRSTDWEEYSWKVPLNETMRIPICYVSNGRNVHVKCELGAHGTVLSVSEIKPTAACWRLQCQPENFTHDYILNSNGKTEPHLNKWKRVRIGQRAGLHDVCLTENGLPVTRNCTFQNGQAVWEDISWWPRVKCMQDTQQRTISVQLNALHDELLQGKRRKGMLNDRVRLASQVHSLLREPNHQLLPADIFVTSDILSTFADEESDASLAPNVVSICRSLMESDRSVLRLSADLNATNSLLDTFENLMDDMSEQFVPQTRCGIIEVNREPNFTGNTTEVESVDFAHIGVHAQLTHDLSVFFVNPRCANITGIAVFSSAGLGLHSAKSGFWYRFLYMNESLETLRQDTTLEVATFVPTILWNKLSLRHVTLVFKVYEHDALFVESVEMLHRKPHSKVLSISIPGINSALPENLPFLLRNLNRNSSIVESVKSGTGCGYWNYETWLTDGVQTQYNIKHDLLRDPVIVCSTKHLTQFAFLLGGSYRQNELGRDILVTPAHEQVLDIISLVGCSLSLLGLLGIWLTAALFKDWRSMASTKVLLNLCVALSLQMVLFVFVNTDDTSEELIADKAFGRCVVLGASLQYSILVLFSWMLIIAVLQFQRYVTVIGIERPRHYILKSAIGAWGFPLIPTLLVACIDPKSYLPTEYQLQTDTGVCYPSGYGLVFGVVLPVSLIIMANLIIFIYVFYSISHSLGQTMQRTEKKLIIKQIRLSVLLFFLLGLSWIFGIFAFMKAGVAFSYLFCITATLQGFVLFLYFVVFDDATRREWVELICPSRMAKKRRKVQELQSMTTSSTNDMSRSSHA